MLIGGKAGKVAIFIDIRLLVQDVLDGHLSHAVKFGALEVPHQLAVSPRATFDRARHSRSVSIATLRGCRVEER
ncbi:hypothetical protein HYQ46_005565 [Verticillium longisporum]|nr:hypothetical protein HYQ46_005565 [Verticillium longisporum]